MWTPLSFDAWLSEIGEYLDLLAADQAVDSTEWKIFCLRKYQEYLASFD